MYYHDSQGRVIGAKTRTKNKIFSYEGETDGAFFGQHLTTLKRRDNIVIITEGELDAASVAEALGDYPCVSLPTGACRS